jgi:hypothetical protein
MDSQDLDKLREFSDKMTGSGIKCPCLNGGGLKKSLKKELTKDLKKAKPITKSAAPAVIKMALPAIASSVASSLGLPPTVGKIVGKVAADALVPKVESKLGSKKKKGEGIGEYKGAAISFDGKSSGSLQQRRGKLMKHIMAKEGLNLGEASKYIKQHNLKY